jgi:hypothetical protein
MTRLALLFALVHLGACFETHSPAAKELRSDDCYSCHVPDYNMTSTPVHQTAGYPTTCGDCHRVSGWAPALGFHPEPRFPIAASAHTNIKCLVCHDLDAGPATAGANTNCIQCHPNTTYQRDSHVGALSPLGGAYAYQDTVPNFCLSCHPAGLANKHPDAKFPRSNPHNVACASCHIAGTGPSKSGANTSCVESGCHHTLAFSDGKHSQVNRYSTLRGDGSNRHFCLDSGCHPNGRKK